MTFDRHVKMEKWKTVEGRDKPPKSTEMRLRGTSEIYWAISELEKGENMNETAFKAALEKARMRAESSEQFIQVAQGKKVSRKFADIAFQISSSLNAIKKWKNFNECAKEIRKKERENAFALLQSHANEEDESHDFFHSNNSTNPSTPDFRLNTELHPLMSTQIETNRPRTVSSVISLQKEVKLLEDFFFEFS